jgi:hypothetical protein
MYRILIGDPAYSSWSLRGWLLLAAFDLPFETVRRRLKALVEQGRIGGRAGGKPDLVARPAGDREPGQTPGRVHADVEW